MGAFKVVGVILITVLLFSCNQKQHMNQQSDVNPDTLSTFSFSKDQKNQINELFDGYCKKNGFNGCVLIGQKDAVFYENSFGYADYASNDTLTTAHTFQLASVSKQFTAVAILQLYQQGKLKLTDSVEHFFPEFPYKGITIHELLTHRSGLANYHYFYQDTEISSDTIIKNYNLITEFINRRPAPYSRPNQRFQYSNTGYALLACIVEKVSGMPFEDYLDHNIFKPLHMETAFAYRGKNGIKKSKSATGYSRYWNPVDDNALDGILGDKGIYCSVYDLFKWDQGLYKGIIINIDTLQLAFQPMGKSPHFSTNYGYGWRIINWGDSDSTSIRILYHAGWWHGFHSLLIHIPQDTTTIVVLKNCNKGKKLSYKSILQILYPLKNIESYDMQTESDTIQTESDTLQTESVPDTLSFME